MNHMRCWHRPGRNRGKTDVRVCRHCGVYVEECPCAPTKRCEPACVACQGSGWVAIVRGHVQKFADYLDARK
jgi:hypothetical protein